MEGKKGGSAEDGSEKSQTEGGGPWWEGDGWLMKKETGRVSERH